MIGRSSLGVGKSEVGSWGICSTNKPDQTTSRRLEVLGLCFHPATSSDRCQWTPWFYHLGSGYRVGMLLLVDGTHRFAASTQPAPCVTPMGHGQNERTKTPMLATKWTRTGIMSSLYFRTARPFDSPSRPCPELDFMHCESALTPDQTPICCSHSLPP